MDDGSLMLIRADTDFTYNIRGRMLSSNEPRVSERRPAPRLFLGRTTDGHVLRFGASVPDDLAHRLEAIINRQPPPGDLRAPPAAAAELRAALESDAPITREESGPAYRFPATIVQSGDAVRLTAANRDLVRETFPWLYDEYADWQPCFAAVHGGAAVAVCFSARIGAQAAEAGVETLSEFRGHGYATAVTAAWGTAVQQAGLVPIYSTSWDNIASQGVARKVGLVLFESSMSWA